MQHFGPVPFPARWENALPFVRANLNAITVFSVNSLALLKNIHEETMSLVDGWENFNNFKRLFLDLTASKMENGHCTRSHNAITIDLSTRQVDADTKKIYYLVKNRTF